VLDRRKTQAGPFGLSLTFGYDAENDVQVALNELLEVRLKIIPVRGRKIKILDTSL
jgi:hypothetical protein